MDLKLYKSLADNKRQLDKMFNNSADFYFKYISIANLKCGVAMFEDIASINYLQDIFLKQIPDTHFYTADSFINNLIFCSTCPVSVTEINCYEQVLSAITGGFAILFIDGADKAVSFPVQSVPSRGVDKPTNENNLRGSKEGFTDVARQNMALIRRRIRTINLTMQTIQIGETSKTEVVICYHSDFCPEKIYSYVIDVLKRIDLPFILDSGYLAPFIDKTKNSLFGSVGYTERADTFCAKVCEGKVGIVVDGTPYALIYPFFFHENFIANDDYAQRPYFASFIRLLRYLAFIIGIMLPGIYVAFTAYAPQSIINKLLPNIYTSQFSTPLPVFIEALIINILFEIIKEASLRFPESVGGPVSIISTLIIGDAAVKLGLIGSATLIVCALSSIMGFIVPSFHEPTIVLRTIFIILSGALGIAGVALGTIILFINIANIETADVKIDNVYNLKTFFKDGIFVKSKRNSKRDFSMNYVKKG